MRLRSCTHREIAAVPKRTRRQVFRVGLAVTAGILMVALPCVAQQLTNDELSLTLNAQEGSYQLSLHDGQPVLRSRVAAQVDHQWLRSSDYPRHQASESTFEDDLGPGREVTVTCSGLDGKPDLIYVLQLYKQRPYGTVQVKVQNSSGKEVTVQAIRSVEAMGEPILNLGGGQSADRVLSDSFSEDWPDLALYDLGGVRGGMHRGAGSQLIYNRESKQSLFLGALTSDRFLTLMHLKAEGMGAKTKIASYTVESTGTTEIQKEFDLKDSPADDQVELSLPVQPGEDMVSERLMFEAGPDYHDQLLAYGDAVRRLHHARVSSETPIGWWSLIRPGLERLALLDAHVAVRSSATAEDSARASFAGIHRSFLNVSGVAAIEQAAQGCIDSLYTPQAVAYRHRMDLKR